MKKNEGRIVTPRVKFEDAQELHTSHPGTFDVPSVVELYKITTGMFVKVCTGHERFWVRVMGVTGNEIRGAVDGKLMNRFKHGLKLGDVIKFEKRHVYAILPALDAKPEVKQDRVNVRLTLEDLLVISARLGGKPEFELWLSSDEEGNSYSPLMQFGATVNFAIDEKRKRITLYPSSMDSVDPCEEDGDEL